MPSYYDVLGVPGDADLEALRRAYHRRAQFLHPDRHAGASEAERREAETAMKALNEAWNTLRSADTRRRYDAQLGLPVPDEILTGEVWDGVWPDEDEEELRPPGRHRTVWLVVAAGLVVAMLASAVAWFAGPDTQPGWSGGTIAQLRLNALNAGMTAPQADCFVEAVTRNFSPSDEVPAATLTALAGACR